MQSDRLRLNSDKTEILWCATTIRQHQLPRSSLLVDGTLISPVQSVRDLGIFIDADLVMRTHVQKTASICFAVLRQLRSVHHLVPATTFQTPGLPAYLFPASSFGDERGSTDHQRPASLDHISDALISLHWLRAQERVRFKTAVLMYKATHATAPSYLSQLVRVADLPGRRSLRSARTNRLLVPPVKLSTVCGRAFPVAVPTIWNNLPDNVISAPSLSTYR